MGVVGKFVEFFGPGVSQLSIADRATISNMCPEYGATVGYFPVDNMSLKYLKQTGTCIYIHTNVYMSTVCMYRLMYKQQDGTGYIHGWYTKQPGKKISCLHRDALQ